MREKIPSTFFFIDTLSNGHTITYYSRNILSLFNLMLILNITKYLVTVCDGIGHTHTHTHTHTRSYRSVGILSVDYPAKSADVSSTLAQITKDFSLLGSGYCPP